MPFLCCFSSGDDTTEPDHIASKDTEHDVAIFPRSQDKANGMNDAQVKDSAKVCADGSVKMQLQVTIQQQDELAITQRRESSQPGKTSPSHAPMPTSDLPSTGSRPAVPTEGRDRFFPGRGFESANWDKARKNFTLQPPEELTKDVSGLQYIGCGGYSKVFKGRWHSAQVAVKFVASQTHTSNHSATFMEALLSKELSHPNLVHVFATRCAQLTEEFLQSVYAAYPGGTNQQASTRPVDLNTSEEFVSGDGFGSPRADEAEPKDCLTWRDIIATLGAKAGDYLTVVIMDYCDWGSLSKAIVKGVFRPSPSKEGRLRFRALLRTCREIAQGLDHLHQLNVVHGDLKPANVLLKGSRNDRRGFVAQLIDFGLSRVVNGSAPASTSAKGTLAYMAPEVFDRKVGKAADLYSFGIVMWEMLVGQRPYHGIQPGQVVLGVQSGELRPQWPGDDYPPLKQLFLQCVSQQPTARPSARHVVELLTQIEDSVRAELKAEMCERRLNKKPGLSSATKAGPARPAGFSPISP